MSVVKTALSLFYRGESVCIMCMFTGEDVSVTIIVTIIIIETLVKCEPPAQYQSSVRGTGNK